MAFFVAAKVDQQDKNIPYINDVLDKLKIECTKEEFLHFERMIFWKVLRGNALIQTPYDIIGEIIAHIEQTGENVSALRDVSLVILESISQNYYAFNQDPIKVASSVVLLAQSFMGSNLPWSSDLVNFSGYK